MNFLLDTNVISEWVKPQPDRNVVSWLAETVIDLEQKRAKAGLKLRQRQCGLAADRATLRRIPCQFTQKHLVHG